MEQILVCRNLLFTLILITSALSVIGQTDLPCFEAVSQVNKLQLKRIEECTKKLNFKNLKEKTERAACAVKCAFQQEGVIDDDGMLDVINMLTFVERNLPSSVHEWTRYIISVHCYPLAINLDASDVTCKSYSPLSNCIVANFALVCNQPSYD